MSEKLNAWCSLLRAPGVGVKTFQALLAAFSTPEAFFNASREELAAKMPRFSLEKLQSWQQSFGSAASDLAWQAGGENRYIICYSDPDYPALLKEITDPPPVLYVLGDLKALSQPQISIVGSRQASEAAKRTCYEFSHYLAQAGFVINSGLALGIDGAAHHGALEGQGKTIAVVGTGLDRVYPARHHDLAKQISQHGAIISEFPIGTGVRSANFPRRNRIISGLSLGVLVVEASLHSGSLITARLAMEQGREVFAIPGSIHNPLARGCHHLIKQGAKLVETAGDILEELHALLAASIDLNGDNPPITGDSPEHLNFAANPHSNLKIKPTGGKPREISQQEQTRENLSLEPKMAELLTAIGYEICSHDDLVARLKLTSEEVSAMLSELELEGHLVALGGGLFQRLN